jgi:hypothetical protein
LPTLQSHPLEMYNRAMASANENRLDDEQQEAATQEAERAAVAIR